MNKQRILCVLLTLLAMFAMTDRTYAESKVSNAGVSADIDGENLTFTVRFDVVTEHAGAWIDVAVGDVVLDEVLSPESGYTLDYDAERKAYRVGFATAGKHSVELTLAAKPTPVGDTSWREASFDMPASRVRELNLTCDRVDLEVELVGAVRVKRDVVNGKLNVTGVQGSDRRFVVRWKPTIRDLDAKLVYASELNTIARVQAGAIRLDTLVIYDVSQGRLESLVLNVPEDLAITQVLGADIRDWSLEPAEGDKPSRLLVNLNRPQTGRYGLQVVGEAEVQTFPTEVVLPVIEPIGGTRAGGHLAVGTDSAISMVVKQAGGLSQIDAQVMPRIILDNHHPRRMPTAKAFFYTYASPAYQMRLELDHVVPTYDAQLRVLVHTGQDEMRINAQAELDVRDASLRQVEVVLPEGLTLVNVTGAPVDDYRVIEADDESSRRVRVSFTQPVIGRVVLDMRLELGRSPLDQVMTLSGFDVIGARSGRGFLVLSSEQGVELGKVIDQLHKLREVNVASVPLHVQSARYAFRFAEPGWGIGFEPERTPPSVSVETFNLISLGDGVAYGNVVLSYYIAGSPIDELTYRIDPSLRNVEFIGRDVRHARQSELDPSLWIVKLQRRVIGDYNLAVTYAQPGPTGSSIIAGGVRCADVESQTGYMVVASHQDVELAAQDAEGSGFIQLDREELPANYRLLVSAPMIACYRTTGHAEPMTITVNAYDHGSLLASVVELTDIHTHIAAQDNGEVESSTTVTFKVKNSSSQFLSLRLPEKAEVWSTRLADGYMTDEQGNIRYDENGVPINQYKRIVASHDKKTGELLIPLQRPRDPNTPMTLELVYGLSHPRLGLAGNLELLGPSGSVASTYDSWHVSAPPGWAVHHVAGNLQPVPRNENHGRVARELRSVLACWQWAIGQVLESVITLWVIAGCAVVLAVVLLVNRSEGPVAIAGLGLVLLVLLGITATNAPAFSDRIAQPDQTEAMSFTQVMSATGGDGVALRLRVAPIWRQYAGVFSAIIVPSIGLLALIAGVVQPKHRIVLVSLGLAALLFGACRLPVLAVPIGHVMTWGLPLLIACVFLWRVAVLRWRGIATRPAAVAALMALSLGMVNGCSSTVAPPIVDNGQMLNRVELDLAVEDDAMAGEMRLKIDTAEPLRLKLLEPGAILMDSEHDKTHVELEQNDGQYDLVVKKPGRYDVTVRFLMPLPPGDDVRARAFEMPIPASLTNRVTLSIPGTAYQVHSPNAVRMTKQESGGRTTLNTIIGHGAPVAFSWHPRSRQRSLEDTVFFAGTTELVRFDAGMIEHTSIVRLDIAKGQIDALTLKAPAGVSVTSVQGAHIGAWRYDPTTRLIEAKLARPATGSYALHVVMQRAVTELPAEVTVSRLEVIGAQQQRGTIGLAQTDSVYIVVDKHPQPVNVDDFSRDAAGLIAPVAPQLSGGIRSAYRAGTDDLIEVTARRVQPELRTMESASFTISDERLIYNGTLTLEVLKAGRFSVDLKLPDGYDIDALNAAEVSHWDETQTDSGRIVAVHFRAKTMGRVAIALTLSRSITELPDSIEAPRVEVVGALKHGGQMVVSSEQGVRVSVAGRAGISEFDPAEVGVRTVGALAFRLLRPGWTLSLNTEVIDPVIDARVLHTAHVLESVVRHRCYIRHHIRHAGAKLFDVRVPDSASGVVITGSEVARISRPDENDPGLFRVELTRKQFARPYQLTVRYETPVGEGVDNVTIEPVSVPGAERQRGFVTVTAGPRVELAEAGLGSAMQPSEARTIPREFGAGDLSDAALCYVNSSADYRLDLQIIRHATADLLDASVRRVDITSVLTEAGESINRVQLEMNVGGKRHLQARLPEGAKLWSLLVGARSVIPSVREDGGEPVYLIPLSPDAAGDLPVQIDLVYTHSSDGRWTQLEGPRFDLPLHNVNLTVYAPPGLSYSDFEGTLGYDDSASRSTQVAHYTAGAYEKQVERTNVYNLNRALDLQEQGDALAAKGQQRAARQAFESAWFYSLSDSALNEDARVQLHQLAEEQALVGLVDNRIRLRQQSGVQQGQQEVQTYGENFDRNQARRLRSSLSKADSENLEAIIARIIETQDAATAAGVPLIVNLPVRGKALHFTRAIQVNPNAPMHVSFDAEAPLVQQADNDVAWSIGVFLMIMILLASAPTVARGLNRPRAIRSDDTPDIEEVPV